MFGSIPLRHVVSTELTGSSAFALLEVFEGLRVANGQVVELSLQNVENVDASGIAVLVRIHSHLLAREARLVLTGAGSAVRSVFEATGLHHIFPLTPQAPRPLVATHAQWNVQTS